MGEDDGLMPGVNTGDRVKREPAITAQVGEPTPLPERPTLYCVAKFNGRWCVEDGGPNKAIMELYANSIPGSVLVTIPGSGSASAAQPAEDLWDILRELVQHHGEKCVCSPCRRIRRALAQRGEIR